MSNQSNRGGRQGFDFKNMTTRQKQACIVLAVCAAALLATIIIVGVILSGASGPAASDSDAFLSGPATGESYDNSAYQVDTSIPAVLAATEDAGVEYVEQTVFVGDSNTVRLYNYNLITLDQFVGAEGMGIQSLTSNACVGFKNDAKAYTIPEALAMMKPRRIVVTMGTNNADGNMTTDDFISQYRAALGAIQSAYSYCDIIVAAVPPIPQDHSAYPELQMQTIDAFNQALAKLCEEEGYSFLNTSEVLKGEDGFGRSDYFVEGDIHLKPDGLKAVLTYLRTHALQTEDRRPDTDNIPARANYSASSSSQSSSSSSSSSSSAAESFKAAYYVEQNTGGTLTGGEQQGQTSLTFDVTAKDTITVTAVPAEGYEFYRWSDGLTTATRTDKEFKQNLSVTAQFVAKPGVSIENARQPITAGNTTTLTAKATGSFAGKDSEIVWTLGNDIVGNGASYTTNANLGVGTYKFTARLTVNGKTVEDTATVTVQAAPTPTPAPTPAPTPSPTPEPAPPSISVGQSSVTITQSETATLTASASGGAAGRDSEIVWILNGAQVGTGPSCATDPSLPAGSYTFIARITVDGKTAEASVAVTVNPITPPEGEDQPGGGEDDTPDA